MTAAAAILRPVSFILDPVPRCDRRRELRAEVARIAVDPADRAEKARITALMGDLADRDPIDTIDWSPLETAAARIPPSSPCPIRPYDWAAQHAWPVDGWGPTT